MRQDFEIWALSYSLSIQKDDASEYADVATALLWKCWQENPRLAAFTEGFYG